MRVQPGAGSGREGCARASDAMRPRAMGIGIGFGFGCSFFDTKARVYPLGESRKEPWLSLETSGGSSMEPGLAGMLIPSPVKIPVAVSVFGAAADGLLRREVQVKRAGHLTTPVGDILLPLFE